jgi:hypothetical protein
MVWAAFGPLRVFTIIMSIKAATRMKIEKNAIMNRVGKRSANIQDCPLVRLA